MLRAGVVNLEPTEINEIRKTGSSSSSTGKPVAGLCVSGSARLHFGFSDPGGRLGRRFGSIGLAIEEPVYRIIFRRLEAGTSACDSDVSDSTLSRLQQYVQRVSDHFGYDTRIGIEVEKMLSVHAGLGSGTQLAIAAGVATCQLSSASQNIYQIAAILDRGSRSSIGAAAFDAGGFIIDGGRDDSSRLPPVIVRHDFPDDWAIILVADSRHEGLSADSEVAAFDNLPEFSAAASGEICRLLLLKVLPALKTHELQPFAEGIGRIQEITGDYFSNYQGGDRFTSASVSQALDWLAANGAYGPGQSSWGPTGYAFCTDAAVAHDLVRRIKTLDNVSGLEFLVTRGKNSGARIIPV